jgi:carbon storage regulator
MLVLSRKENQTIKVGDDCYITVVRIRGNNVRIGIEAPDCVHIIRLEVVEELSRAEVRARQRIEQKAKERADARALQEAAIQAAIERGRQEEEASWLAWHQEAVGCR